jgi:hypothetical protein
VDLLGPVGTAILHDDAFYTSMKAPSLEFVYRLVAKMHPTDGYDISNVMGTGDKALPGLSRTLQSSFVILSTPTNV